jgi:hypothetical protein
MTSIRLRKPPRQRPSERASKPPADAETWGTDRRRRVTGGAKDGSYLDGDPRIMRGLIGGKRMAVAKACLRRARR